MLTIRKLVKSCSGCLNITEMSYDHLYMALLPSEGQELCQPSIPVSIALCPVWAPVDAEHGEPALPVKGQPPCIGTMLLGSALQQHSAELLALYAVFNEVVSLARSDRLLARCCMAICDQSGYEAMEGLHTSCSGRTRAHARGRSQGGLLHAW